MMRNVLNRKKNQILDFSDFYFSSYGHFCSRNCPFPMNFHDNSKNKNRKMDFSFDSALYASFMKMGVKLRGGSAYPYLGQGPSYEIVIEQLNK